MNKSAKNSVAFFLAAALITGVFSISTPSIIDVEATGDKKDDYKQNDRYEEKDYGYEEEKKYSHDDREKKYGYEEEEKKYAHDDRDKKYGNDDKKYGYEEEMKYGNDDKKYGYEEEKKYGYGDEDKKYAYAEEEKYGNEKKYGYEEDNKYGDKDKDKPIKYVSCQNININGKSFQKDGMNRGHSDYGGESSYPELMAYGEESSYGGSSYGGSSYGGSSYGENSYMNHNSKPDYVKETHKDVTIICIQKNDKRDKDPKTPEEECDKCIRALPGQYPSTQHPDGTGQTAFLLAYLEANFDDLMLDEGTFAALCEAILAGDFDAEMIADLADAAFPANPNASFIQEFIACLSALVGAGEEEPPVP